ncbi:MAG TPA: Rrf2 family transcriptional regulator [Acidimicrobiales bacterium]|nr:Rrf2 family transcriptional regulator [Acidimicrobiales bacterium]
MKLVPTRRTDYGVRALIYLANAEKTPVKAIDISTAMDIPMGFLQQVLQELQRGRLVTSRSGPNGGYALARPAGSVTVREIVEVLEGPLDQGECALRGGPCYWEDVCALHWVWSAAREALCQQLDAATLARVAADDRAIAEGRAAVPADSHRRRRSAGAPRQAVGAFSESHPPRRPSKAATRSRKR